MVTVQKGMVDNESPCIGVMQHKYVGKEGGKEWRGRREHIRNARLKRLKMSATGCYGTPPGTTSGCPCVVKEVSHCDGF